MSEATAWPVDQRQKGCTCKSGIDTFDELLKVIELAQSEYKAQWAAFEETAKLLESFGWKDGVGVQDEFGINTYDEEDPYKLSWVVQEGVYLATGHGNIGNLNGGYQDGDFMVAEEPLIDQAIDYILANPRCQRTPNLTKEQGVQFIESFKQAYHMHLHFYVPMSRLWVFVYEKLGEYPNSMAIPDDMAEELWDWFWEMRHGSTNTAAPSDANELLALLTKAQPIVKERAVTMWQIIEETLKRRKVEVLDNAMKNRVKKQLDALYNAA